MLARVLTFSFALIMSLSFATPAAAGTFELSEALDIDENLRYCGIERTYLLNVFWYPDTDDEDVDDDPIFWSFTVIAVSNNPAVSLNRFIKNSSLSPFFTFPSTPEGIVETLRDGREYLSYGQFTANALPFIDYVAGDRVLLGRIEVSVGAGFEGPLGVELVNGLPKCSACPDVDASDNAVFPAYFVDDARVQVLDNEESFRPCPLAVDSSRSTSSLGVDALTSP